MNTTVGTCGRCGGRVSVPTVYMSIIPPTPACEGCGATPKSAHGPVIEMGEPRRSLGERLRAGEPDFRFSRPTSP